ncbi:MAG: 3-hydroxyacyl-CoA dehydrogenase family protein [Bacteroidota bacterium]|nr:3-hydroxyacyl-CoA dehydrogenase family protein [Bacteroidota bacterium]
MHIIIIGTTVKALEFLKHTGITLTSIQAENEINGHKVYFQEAGACDYSGMEKGADLLVHLEMDNYEYEIDECLYTKPKFLLISSIFHSVAQLLVGATVEIGTTKIAGINTLDYFLALPKKEIAYLYAKEEFEWKAVMSELAIDYLPVGDRVGMVTARVVCMIINEAYYTVQENISTKEDIDTAMKLGVNYPFGPFEWSTKIGLAKVYQLIDALYEDTHDVRYKICSLLKREVMLSQI